jgi:tetratricopeptide (TPR) repeat protein
MGRSVRFFAALLWLLFAGNAQCWGQVASVKWAEGDLLMPKSGKIQLRFGTDPVAAITDIQWPATVQKVKGHWLLIGDDGSFRADGKIVRGWVSNKEVVQITRGDSVGKATKGYSDLLKKSPKSQTLHWLRAIALEYMQEYGAAIQEYDEAIMDASESTATDSPTPAQPSGPDLSAAPTEMRPATSEMSAKRTLGTSKVITADSYAGRGRCQYAQWAASQNEQQEAQDAQESLAVAIWTFSKADPNDFACDFACNLPGAPARYYLDKAEALRNVFAPAMSYFDNTEALCLVERALEANSTSVRALVVRGRIFQSKLTATNPPDPANRQSALDSFDSAIALAPTDPTPQYARAQFINQLPAGIAATTAERQLAVDSAAIAAKAGKYRVYKSLVELARAEFRNEKFEEAVIYQKLAVDLAPQVALEEQKHLLFTYCAKAGVEPPSRLLPAYRKPQGLFATKIKPGRVEPTIENLQRLDQLRRDKASTADIQKAEGDIQSDLLAPSNLDKLIEETHPETPPSEKSSVANLFEELSDPNREDT